MGIPSINGVNCLWWINKKKIVETFLNFKATFFSGQIARTSPPIGPIGGRCPHRWYPCGRYECRSDYDCNRGWGRRGRVCCNQGCSSRCERPPWGPDIGEKPGVCPRRNPWSRRRRRCGRPCRRDRDCRGRRKCCYQRRCGRVCIRPRGPVW